MSLWVQIGCIYGISFYDQSRRLPCGRNLHILPEKAAMDFSIHSRYKGAGMESTDSALDAERPEAI